LTVSTQPAGSAEAVLNAPSIVWTENGESRFARWQSERGSPPPKTVLPTDDRITADDAYGLACQGMAMLWRSDFQNARQLLIALGTRADRKSAQHLAAIRQSQPGPDTFNRIRQIRAQRARTLGMLLVELDIDYRSALRRAPDVTEPCLHAYGPSQGPMVVSLRELTGVIGAYQWASRGIELSALGARIHPHYGVFAPTRSEYVDLVARAPLPTSAAQLDTAIDIGTGTGVLAAVLARRGVKRVIGIDSDPRAIACATENIERLGLSNRVQIQQGAFFPDGRASLIVCNPPWVPARPGSPLERGIYDEGCAMLRGFLAGLADHLTPEGEGWLILSDLAEHLGLRTRETLLQWIDAAGLEVAGRLDTRPSHPRSSDANDPLQAARRAEVTSLWRLKRKHADAVPA